VDQELLLTVQEFHACKQEEAQSLEKELPIYLTELMKKKKLSQGASTSGLKGSRKPKPGALSLYVGDGHHVRVEAIREFHLSLHSGLVLLLHNCHYASSITRGIILVSSLYKDGFANCFENDNLIFVSKNNLIYFNAIPRDDIYEIDMSSFNTNDSSIKKRIEKLQHSGLLDSTDIKSLEKCVSCMFGKMVRKPYSHQVERVKDLLGLIHTNVCGPFKIMSSQGAYYFVTFTEDFRYPKETMEYSFYYLPENKVFVARNAKFLENSLINQEASGSLEDLKIIQEEDTHSSIDTSLNHEEGYQEINEPQSNINPIRRSIRTRRALDHMCLYIDAEEHDLEDLGKPADYKPALLDPKYDKWLNDMNVEMQCMKDNKIWELVDLPPNEKTVGHKWLFKKKTDMDGAVHTYKACLVAKAFTETPMIHYEETFSPITDIRAIKILIAIAAFYDYEIWKLDVKNAFLNRYLIEEIYMEQLEGNNIPMLQDVKSYLGRCFAKKDLGEAAYILGIKIYRDRSKQ
nr:hypothetical protein [Tanacetum cinerariifolium]